jgi:hypothetical protein
LPLFVRPCLYVTYRYGLRLGVLDGREGFIFHVLQAFWYRLLVDINIMEAGRHTETGVGSAGPAGHREAADRPRLGEGGSDPAAHS